MRRVGDELPLGTERRFELSEHRVEARAEAAQFVTTARGDTAWEVARPRDLFDRRGQALHRCERGTGDEQTEEGGQDDRGDRKLGERDPRLGERAVDIFERLSDLKRTTVRDRPDEHANAIVLRGRGREESIALAGGDVLDVLRDQ